MKSSTRERQFNAKTKRAILLRDGGCIFCQREYHMKCNDSFQLAQLDAMHYVNKSAGGQGIEQNGAIGCRYHHALLDNGNKGIRQEMLDIFKEHLQSQYEDWNEKDLYFDKYKEMEERKCL